jgi:hypothetical protein
MKSFELMDTLFTRYCKREDLFGYIEEHHPYPGFKEKRMKAETMSQSKSLEQIYESFKELTEVCPLEVIDALKEYEFQLELENSIPILCNIRLIDPEDIFLTDDSFTKEQWLLLCRKHGIPEQKLYTETDPEIPETVHLGTRLNRVNRILSNTHSFSLTEELLYESPLVKRCRAFRLRNPHPEQSDEYKRYEEKSVYILPILLLFCLDIRRICVEEKRTRVLFCNQGIYEMYLALFPETECILFSSSPIIQQRPTTSYREYVQSLYHEHTLIVDLQKFFQMDGYLYRDLFGNIPRVHVLVHEGEGMPTLSSSIVHSYFTEDRVDALSHDSRGVLFSRIEGHDLRLHETKPKPEMEMLRSFAAEFIGIDIDLEPGLLLKLIESYLK